MKNRTKKDQIATYKNLFMMNKGTPMAVSSESQAHKDLRYSIIAQLFNSENTIEVHDVGMGLANYYTYLRKKFPKREINYSGSDILKEYVNECKTKFPTCKFYLRDIAEKSIDEKYDYVVMSGTFHQRRNSTIGEWESFYQQLIKNCFQMSRKGIAFNFISPFVDFYQEEVYYCNLPKLLNFINDDLSRFFTIHHNYPLFEFTVFVYRKSYIQESYQQPELQKYY